MKKFLKVFGISLLSLLVLIGLGALYFSVAGIPTFETKKIDLKVEVTPERVAKGKKIASLLCAGCHMDNKTGVLTGKVMEDVPDQFGTIRSRNITQDKTHGIGSWTDGEIAYLLRTGIKRDGVFAPIMANLAKLDDEEFLSVIAFLRSDDPMVRAAAVPDQESDYSLLSKILSRTAFQPKEYPTKPIHAPNPSDRVAYGKYLVTVVGDCYGCHSASFTSLDDEVPENSEGYLGGNNEFKDINGRAIYSRNITPDAETGIGKWSEANFIRAVRDGFRPDNTPLRYPMQRYIEFTDDELRSIYAYLRTVPAIKNPTMKSEEYVAAASNASKGEHLYQKYACYSCHGTTGEGICDLRGAGAKYPNNDSLIAWIRDPSLIKADSKMPTWDGVIAEDEYAPLAEYVRLLGERARKSVK